MGVMGRGGRSHLGPKGGSPPRGGGKRNCARGGYTPRGGGWISRGVTPSGLVPYMAQDPHLDMGPSLALGRLWWGGDIPPLPNWSNIILWSVQLQGECSDASSDRRVSRWEES